MAYGGFRSSTGELGLYDDPRPPVERWDRDKFDRFARQADERESFRFQERYGGGRREVEVEDRIDRRGPRGRFEERDRYFEEDRFGPPRRGRTDLFEEPTPAEIANRALAPYRRKSIVERDFDPPARRPARPQYIRRQSSLDTFDRRPLARYGDREREEWRPPANVPIPLPIRRSSPSRRRSPSRRYREEEFEEIRYRDVEPDGEEEYRDIKVRREKSTRRRARSESRRASTTRSSSSSFEEVSPVHESGKRGKTRMPKRLVRKEAIVQLGYPFEEEENFIIIRRALGKEQIDEIIEVSKSYKENRTTYKYEETVTKEVEAPPPPPVVLQTTTTEVVQAPPPPPAAYYPPPQTVHPPPGHPPPMSVRSPSPPRSVHGSRSVYEERVEEHVGGPLTIVLPERNRRSDRDVKREIQALETERRALRLEREAEEKRIQAERIRESDYEYEFVERESRERSSRESKERDVVRIEKDRKGRSRSKPPNPKLVAMAMSTLT